MRRDSKPKLPPRSNQRQRAPPPFAVADQAYAASSHAASLSHTRITRRKLTSHESKASRTYDHTGIADQPRYLNRVFGSIVPTRTKHTALIGASCPDVFPHIQPHGDWVYQPSCQHEGREMFYRDFPKTPHIHTHEKSTNTNKRKREENAIPSDGPRTSEPKQSET